MAANRGSGLALTSADVVVLRRLLNVLRAAGGKEPVEGKDGAESEAESREQSRCDVEGECQTDTARCPASRPADLLDGDSDDDVESSGNAIESDETDEFSVEEDDGESLGDADVGGRREGAGAGLDDDYSKEQVMEVYARRESHLNLTAPGEANDSFSVGMTFSMSTGPTAQAPVHGAGRHKRPSAATPEAQNSFQCWDHGCNGRVFSTRSNLVRHRKEQSVARPSCRCNRCGAIFSRTTARNEHVARGSCNRIRRYSNGRARPEPGKRAKRS